MKKLTLGVIIAVLIAAIAIIVLLSLGNNQTNSTLSIGNSPVLGDANAPVTIYEFSDFSCPYCAAAEGSNPQVMDYLKSNYPGWEAPVPLVKENYVKSGKVKIVFKYYPGHGSAVAAHAVALGLNEQNSDLFWEFAERAFALQSTNTLNDLAKMKVLAKDIGANMTQLESYLNSTKYEAQLREDIQMAENNNVEGTPSFFINGESVSGAQSFSAFQDIIDNLL